MEIWSMQKVHCSVAGKKRVFPTLWFICSFRHLQAAFKTERFSHDTSLGAKPKFV